MNTLLGGLVFFLLACAIGSAAVGLAGLQSADASVHAEAVAMVHTSVKVLLATLIASALLLWKR